MLILDQLRQGNIHPFEEPQRPNSEYSAKYKEMERYDELIKAELSPQGLDALEKYLKLSDDINNMAGSDSFASGFRTAALMMIDVFNSKNN